MVGGALFKESSNECYTIPRLFVPVRYKLYRRHKHRLKILVLVVICFSSSTNILYLQLLCKNFLQLFFRRDI